jgi:hypothetical protein
LFCRGSSIKNWHYKLVWRDLVWPLLTGGHYSDVAVQTGLTVLINKIK